MSYRQMVTNDDGEPLGFESVYDDGLDPDEWYESHYGAGSAYDDGEPERCEMDMKDGSVCQRVLSVDGYCGNESEHTA